MTEKGKQGEIIWVSALIMQLENKSVTFIQCMFLYSEFFNTEVLQEVFNDSGNVKMSNK